MLPLELLHILACPICKEKLIQPDESASLRCTSCNRNYPVIEGIPLMLPEQTVTISPAKYEAS